jgi:FOG: WD40-like repeat
MSRFRVTTVIAAIVAATVVGGASSHGFANGTPPPEIGENAATGWPAHNYDLSNSRANLKTDINSTNVATLKQKWAFKLPYSGAFGAFTSNPLVLNSVVYFEDPDSNVYALDQGTGAVKWVHKYKSITPSGGPNGVAFGYGLVYGATENKLFALDPATGKQMWVSKQLTTSKTEGIDMAPQLFGNKVLISTIPGSSTSFYAGNAYGKVYALDAKTGKVDWMFSTVQGGEKLWGKFEGEQRRRPVVSAVGRQPGPRVPRGRQSGALARQREVSERLQPSGTEPVHQLSRRARRRHGQGALVPASQSA